MDIMKLLKAWQAVQKADPNKTFKDFVEDYTDDEHGIPGEAELVTGKPQASSGEGAVRMTREYSDPAPQGGMTQEYIAISRMIDKAMRSIEGMGKSLTAHDTILASILAHIAKGEPTAGDAESLLAKATSEMKKARKIIIKSELDEDEDEEEREENLSRAEKALNTAKSILLKAEDDDEEEDEEEAEKCRATHKSLVKQVKALREAAKAKKAASNQASHEDPETGNQADEAAAKSLEAAVTAVLTKLGITKSDPAPAQTTPPAPASTDSVTKADLAAALQPVQATVKDVMEAILGRSVNGAAPALQKSDAQAIMKARIARVQDAIDGEELNDLDAARASTILSHLSAAQEGKYDMNIVMSEIDKASYAVSSLFKAA
jgi:hypothetical protein